MHKARLRAREAYVAQHLEGSFWQVVWSPFVSGSKNIFLGNGHWFARDRSKEPAVSDCERDVVLSAPTIERGNGPSETVPAFQGLWPSAKSRQLARKLPGAGKLS